MIFSTMSNISLMSTLILTLVIYNLNVNAELNENELKWFKALETVFKKWDNYMKENSQNNQREPDYETMANTLNRCKTVSLEMLGKYGLVSCLKRFLNEADLIHDLFSAPFPEGSSVKTDIETFITENEGIMNTDLKNFLEEFKNANVNQKSNLLKNYKDTNVKKKSSRRSTFCF